MKLFFCFLFLMPCLHALSQGTYDISETPYTKTSSKPYKEAFLQFWYMPDGSIRNPVITIKSKELLSLNNKDTWAFIQYYYKDKFIDSDTTFFDHKTLQPLFYRTNIASQGYKENVTFFKDSIKIVIDYKDSSKVKTYAVKNMYISATLLESMISKLPLQKEYSTEIRVVNAGLNYAEMISSIKVIEKENLIFGTGITIPCWKLEITTGSSKSIQWYTINEQSLVKSELRNRNQALFVKTKISLPQLQVP